MHFDALCHNFGTIDSSILIRYEQHLYPGVCRDYSSHLKHLSEKLNPTPDQEEDIRNPEKYGKAVLATGPPLPVLAECPGRV